MTSKLFSPITLRGTEVSNRIVVSPMCQYSATDGTVGDWHLMHLGQYAISGAGLVFVEATGVEPEGRITPGCPGLYSDENEGALTRVIQFCRDYGNAKIAIQLGHAGRKSSISPTWKGSKPVGIEEGGWQTVAPSAVAHAPGWPQPAALDEAGLSRVKDAYTQAVRRALRIGFDVFEIHAAHGYLLHEFLSPLSNQRTDSYGGSQENRMRFPLEVFEAVRREIPDDLPFGVRVSATDWVDGGWDINGTVEFAKALKERGCDFIDTSSGGLSHEQKITLGPGYQTGFAEQIRQQCDIPTIAVGMITDPHQAESILQSGQADMIALARGMLYNPRWAWHAAHELGEQVSFPPQYHRSHAAFLAGQPTPGDLPPVKN